MPTVDAANYHLRDFVRLKPRFLRSINIEKDFSVRDLDEDYIVTSLTRKVLARIVSGLRITGGNRCWTLTGPYGSGKSAFALFLARILNDESSGQSASERSLKSADYPLWQALFDRRKPTCFSQRLLPILVTGQREPLRDSIAAGIRSAIDRYSLQEMRVSIKVGKYFDCRPNERTDRMLIDVVEHMLNACGQRGVLLVVDELGKSLEHAASDPDSRDLYLLQSLAELSQRCKEPMVLVTILHQSFDQYASGLPSKERSEWMKVQGRFEDIAFQDNQEQNLRLIAAALERLDCDPGMQLSLGSEALRLAEEAISLKLVPAGILEPDFRSLVAHCYPLHPLVALLLTPAFRRFAQSERTLFAFLGSSEPRGFQEFLSELCSGDSHCRSYTLDRFYDYLGANMGGAVYSSSLSGSWVEIEYALDAIEPENELCRSVVKAIGLLSLKGLAGLVRATPEILAFALKVSLPVMQECLATLCLKSVLVFRNFNQSYAIWEGSDFDLESALKSRRQAAESLELVDLLRQERPVPPLIAHRHSAEFGVLRYFDVKYWTATDKAFPTFEGETGDADGLLILLVGMTGKTIPEWVSKCSASPLVVVAVAPELDSMSGLLSDLRGLKELLNSERQIANDRVARREIRGRITELNQALRAALDSFLDDLTATGTWFHGGQGFSIGNRRDLTSKLSQICDTVYSSTPVLRNELLHRRILSSAAASARNSLIRAMLTRADKESLGFEGHPLERSMYESVLASPGVHRCEGGEWGFVGPLEGHPDRLIDVWKALDARLLSEPTHAVRVDDLFRLLKCPPYGLKEGPLPLLLCAYLLSRDDQVVMYEDSAFVPRPGLEHFERLTRNPQKFSLQQYSLTSESRRLVESMGQDRGGERGLVSFLRVIYRSVAGLPLYSRATSRLSLEAIAVRNALLDSTNPVLLVQEVLPKALNATRSGNGGLGGIDQALQLAIAEIEGAYSQLLARIGQKLQRVFDVDLSSESDRTELSSRARKLGEMAIEEKSKVLALRLANEAMEIEPWLESIATFLLSKPPKSWVDRDEDTFDLALSEFGVRFFQLEELAKRLDVKLSQPSGASQPTTSQMTSLRPSPKSKPPKPPEEVTFIDSLREDLMRMVQQGQASRAQLASALNQLAGEFGAEIE